DCRGAVAFSRRVDCFHDERMDDGALGVGNSFLKVTIGEFIHEKADRAAVHAVDRFAAVPEAMKRLQHQTVAAERNHDLGLFRGHVAVTRGECALRGFGFFVRARDEGDLVVALHGFVHGNDMRMAAMKDEPVLVYTTYPSLVEAEKAGRGLVETGLCACVNILPAMR